MSTPIERMAILLALVPAASSQGQAFGLAEQSPQTKACVACHKTENPVIYQQWGASKHYRANIGCFECHGAAPGEIDAYQHYDQLIATLVTPRDCARCHSREASEFAASRHAKGALIIGSLDNTLAEIVEGNRGMKTAAFPEGIAASAVTGCWQCHGSEVKLVEGNRPDPATWPNSGIGRINPDGSEGACNACHSRHEFSVAQSRHPDTCGKCHLGPDHPQKEIYEESKHGINFFTNIDRMNLTSSKWIVGEDYWAAPTCATCHMSATRTQPVTHDPGLRISWNNRPELSLRPEAADAQLDLPGAGVRWQTRRANMANVCLNCHQKSMVDAFYTQYDELVELYNSKFAAPGKSLYDLAKPLLKPDPFSNTIDWTWYELWHHEGRRARHGAAMMAPDYTHWHGMYEVARRFYGEYVPQLESLIAENVDASEPERSAAARALQARLDEIMSSEDHKWYRGKLDPAEAERRRKAGEEFRRRYEK